MLIRSVLCAQLGTEQWNSLQASNEQLYPWDEKSTYIHKYVLRRHTRHHQRLRC